MASFEIMRGRARRN